MCCCLRGHCRPTPLFVLLLLTVALGGTLLLPPPPCRAAEARQESPGFHIRSYDISGNTIFGDDVLLPLLKKYTGPAKTADDVEAARSAVEKYYHAKGYPTVLVNIPEQNASLGEIRLEVIESTIRRVRVIGNRYYTMKKILKLVPSLRPGTVLYLPQLQADLARLNRHPDLKVAPTLSPGKEPGTIDVELKVVDKLPLHGSLELNNRSTHTTTDLRLNALIKYDNLWQRDHSATIQYQTAPEDTSEVQALAGSYVMAPFWSEDQILAIYGIYSDSESAFGEGFHTTGKGYIVGLRDVIPLGASSRYYHNATVGLDYKDFKERLGFADPSQEDLLTPVSYVALAASYGAVEMDPAGATEINLGINLLLRKVVTDRRDFEDKRYKSRANYVYVDLDLKRTQHLGAGWDLVLDAQGQAADQPLVSNEQFYVGGMNSVNGYMESEAGGDDAVRGRLELVTPDLWGAFSRWKQLDLRLHGYYDYAHVWSLDPLPGEQGDTDLRGTGAALTGSLGDLPGLEWAVQWGMALSATDNTAANAQLVYFTVKGNF
jgi:hemolysin activation/secretion protein